MTVIHISVKLFFCPAVLRENYRASGRTGKRCIIELTRSYFRTYSGYFSVVKLTWEPLLLPSSFSSVPTVCLSPSAWMGIWTTRCLCLIKSNGNGLNHLLGLLTRSYVFIYLSVSVPESLQVPFACLSTMEHNTNTPAITRSLLWPLKVSSSTQGFFLSFFQKLSGSQSLKSAYALTSRGPYKHHSNCQYFILCCVPCRSCKHHREINSLARKMNHGRIQFTHRCCYRRKCFRGLGGWHG